jgi:hypothetical protein
MKSKNILLLRYLLLFFFYYYFSITMNQKETRKRPLGSIMIPCGNSSSSVHLDLDQKPRAEEFPSANDDKENHPNVRQRNVLSFYFIS